MNSSTGENVPTKFAELNIPAERMPRHVAIIMDGNGRWARSRGLPRIEGHRKGAQSVRNIGTACAEIGIECLTLYSFSMENWKRPREEVNFLMDLLAMYMKNERPILMKNNIRLRIIGRKQALSPGVIQAMDETVQMTSGNTGMILCLAINYSGRAEIVDAVRDITRLAGEGHLKTDDVNEELIERHLYTAGLPDPDLMIRTSGEMRISNFLLWKLAYAELYVTDVLWPDFGREDLYKALVEYSRRDRRFGSVTA
jgi:undecaprenyl diphosphate synthase